MIFEFKKTKINTFINKALGKLEILTNRLKLQKVSKTCSKRKLVISTKNLALPGLEEGSLFSTEIVEGSHIKITPARIGDTKVRKVSHRTYKNREDYIEPVIDMRHQENLDKGIKDATHVRIVYTKTEVLIFPLEEHAASAIKNPKECEMSVGIDEDDIYSGILTALEKIKSAKYSHITIKSDDSYFNSRENVIFRIQLRRLGYEIGQYLNGQFTATIVGAKEAETKDIIHFEPPKIETSKNHDVANTFDFARPLSTHTVCTGGVDIKCFENEGFENLAITEYRTIEARDIKKIKCKETGEVIGTRVNDKTDAYALCATFNSQHSKVLFNEDVYHLNYDDVKEYTPYTNNLVYSLPCTDFTPMKNKADKEKSIVLLNTTVDMFVEALDHLKKSKASTFLVENVKTFSNSIERKLLTRGLKSLGMKIHEEVLDARNYNGMSQRERYYLFATKLDSEFSFPQHEVRTKNAWRDVVLPNIDKAKVVSHCVSVKKGVETGRIRLIREGDDFSPAIVRSQLRATKDSVYIYYKGEYLLPPVDMLQRLMGIPTDFDTSGNTLEEQSEITGQSIEFRMHSLLCTEIKKHILSFVERANCVSNITQSLKTTVKKVKKEIRRAPQDVVQLSLDF